MSEDPGPRRCRRRPRAAARVDNDREQRSRPVDLLELSLQVTQLLAKCRTGWARFNPLSIPYPPRSSPHAGASRMSRLWLAPGVHRATSPVVDRSIFPPPLDAPLQGPMGPYRRSSPRRRPRVELRGLPRPVDRLGPVRHAPDLGLAQAMAPGRLGRRRRRRLGDGRARSLVLGRR